MTERIQCSNIGTQTALPKTNLLVSLLNNSNRSTFEEHIERNEQLLQSQMNGLQEIDEKLKQPMKTISPIRTAVSGLISSKEEYKLMFERTELDIASNYTNDHHHPEVKRFFFRIFHFTLN